MRKLVNHIFGVDRFTMFDALAIHCGASAAMYASAKYGFPIGVLAVLAVLLPALLIAGCVKVFYLDKQ